MSFIKVGHETFHNSFPFIESEWGFGLLPPQLSHATEGKVIDKSFKFHIQRYSMTSEEMEYIRKVCMTIFLFLLFSKIPMYFD